MRDEIELGPAAPSGISRLMVLVATLGAVIIGAWVLVPVLLNNYVAHSTRMAPAKQRAVAEERAIPLGPAAVLAPTPASAAVLPPPPDAPPSMQRADAALADLDTTAALPADATEPAPSGPMEVAAATSWPAEPPPPVQPTAPALQLAAAPPAPADATINLPLPRSRPSRTIAARLAIPLPRPRPEIASDGPSAEEKAFERDVERMR